jgi:predicted RND superfamily exporter protein
MHAKEPRLGRALGALSNLSASKPWRVVSVIAVMTLFMGLGMIQLESDTDMLKILPKNHPTTLAAQNASEQFHGFYDYVTIFYEIDEGKCLDHAAKVQFRVSQANCSVVTDEIYVRGMEEVWQFVSEREESVQYAIDLAGIVKLVNYTNSGLDPQNAQDTVLAPLLAGNTDGLARPVYSAFSMPDTSPQGGVLYEAAWQGALAAAGDNVNDAIAPTLQAGRTLLFFDSETYELSRVDLGNRVYELADEYQAAIEACDDPSTETECTLQWNVFSSDGLAVRGIASTDAHSSKVTGEDISILAPIIIWAIIVILYVAFRDMRVVLVSGANLLISFLWTAGLMGWLNIPFSALNMTVIPLILGVGIDYGIHMVSEFLEHKGDGLSNAQSFREAGSRAGIAMAIATITTISGLTLMAFSPSILMAQLGIVSSIALLVTFLFTLSFIPALLTLTRKDASVRKQKGSRWILGLSRAIFRFRVLVIVLVLLGSAGAMVNVNKLEPEGFGNPELNFPRGDRVRDDAEFIFDTFYGGNADAQANFLVVEGDITRPEVHVFIDQLMIELEEHPDIQGFAVNSLTNVLRAYLALEQGTPDAILNQVILGNTGQPELQNLEYPTTSEEMKATFDDLFETPMANFMTILLAEPHYGMATVTYDTYQSLDFDEVTRIWDATQEAIQSAKDKTGVDDVNVQPFGNNAFSYLFIEEEQPWVNTIGIVSFFLVIIMIALLTRNVKATACTTTVMLVTSLWWLGTLPLLGVGLSVGLMLPMVFIMAIGTDDAIHLIWNMELTDNRNKVYRFVGKAVLLTSVTTLVAFGLFSFQTDLLVRKTLIATSIAIVIMWVSTMLIVPLFYPPSYEVADDAPA